MSDAATDSILYRATMDLHAEGRTLVGLAVPWDIPARVQDDARHPSYLEAFSPNVFTRSLDNHKGSPFPVFSNHGWKRGEDPVGVATFERTKAGLIYAAPLSRTRAADEQLELVLDGAKKAVSLGFEPYKSRQVKTRNGVVTMRTEAALLELSLTATGFGQHPMAGVAAVRSIEELEEVEEPSVPAGTPKRDALVRELAELDAEYGRYLPRS